MAFTPQDRSKGGKSTVEKYGDEVTRRFDRMRADPAQKEITRLGSQKGGLMTAGQPKVYSGDDDRMKGNYASFAKKIREITRDGWLLIDRVMEIFDSAMEEGKFELALNCATWLADRGFGKPVQVTALTDMDGNPVAFSLWQPAIAAAAEELERSNVIDVEPAKAPLTAKDFSPPAKPLEVEPDGYALGPARIWGVGESEPRVGE